MAGSKNRSSFSDYLRFVLVSVLAALVILGSLTHTMDNNVSEARNLSHSLTRIKRNPAPSRGYFFPIAMYSVRHHKPAPERGRDNPETWEYRGQYFYGYRPRTTSSRRKTARLLAAGLPLLLAPLLSIIFSFPVLVPVATVTSQSPALFNPLIGRRKKKRKRKKRNVVMEFKEERDKKLKELQAVANYLHEVDYNEHQQSRVMVNYLQCNGLLSPEDHCIERLCCEFSDNANDGAPELEKTVTSILVGHILNNEFIPRPFKRRLKIAAQFGRKNSGRCSKFYCPYVDDNWDYTSVYPPAAGSLKKPS